MSDFSRLAILERGEPAVRMVAAVGTYNRSSGRPAITTVLAHTESRQRPWFAREADEVLMLGRRDVVPSAPAPSAGEPQAFVAVEIAAALAAAGCDAVWIGMVPCQDHPGLVTACEQAGMTVIGPDSSTLNRLADPNGFARVLERAGVAAVDGRADRERLRSLEVLVLADGAGTVWPMEPRDVSVNRDGHTILVEAPAPGLSEDLRRSLRESAAAVVSAAGIHGASVVQFLVDAEAQTVACQGVDCVARPRYAIVEESSGRSILPLRLHLASGGTLDGEPPFSEGHVVVARLLAHDPDIGYEASGGSIEMLAMPVGTGVRVDGSIREGDQIDAVVDPVIATYTARGHDRAEAFGRLEQALERTTVVLEIGASNRSGLIALLAHPDIAAGGVTNGWYAARLAEGSLRPSANRVALLAAAIEAYEADLSLVRSAFFASAERGRPLHPEAVGSRMALSYHGVDYRLRVDRTAPGTYRIHDGVPVDVSVDRLGDFERRITIGGHRHTVVAIEQGAAFRIEVDGAAHTVMRDDGVVVRTGWPALVAQVLVEPGQTINAGDPVAVLESMKMVSTVTSPFDGVVTSIAVIPNAQVERGAPLLRIKASGGLNTPLDPAATGNRVDLSDLAIVGDGPAGKPCDWVFERFVNYLLGYDLDPARLKALTGEYQKLAATAFPGDPRLLQCEDALLDLFADIGSLYRPRVEAVSETGDGEETAVLNTQEYFIAFLQWLDADRAGLPERYRARLERALARYGVTGLSRTRELEEAMVWMFRSFSRVPELASVIAGILQRRLEHHVDLATEAGPLTRRRMERLVWACEGRQQLVADLARDVIFHYFDEPVMEAVVADVHREMAVHLAALREDPLRADRAERIGRLVWCPHPMRAMLLDSWLHAVPDGMDLRAAILEVYAFRFYRMRELTGFQVGTVEGIQLGSGEYPHNGSTVHLVVAYLPLDDIELLGRAVAKHLEGVAADALVVVDLVTWRDGDRPDIATTAGELRERIARCEFGRPLHRLDFTLTFRSEEDSESHRTQHVTFRQDDKGDFVEEVLYRNLHPMLAKRLDLWRLSNFTLERLPSPEDVYLFSGVAHENPKDHRLFALAEVRDLVPVRDTATGAVTYPRLGRIGLLALATMRSALAAYPPRERPLANRLVLSVRPPWTIPSSQLQAIVESYEPLARGAGLEKLVAHVKVPSQGPGGRTRLEDKVIFVEGIGRSGATIRLGEPGPNPVRPLTRYAQKLLTAKRFGSPYPYEIAQMLTPEQGSASMFPPGSFQELDLDGDDNLVPVDRPPAENTAHLVVGLITNYTEVVPEGMTRIALMSDPTQGLGNLSEPECRRINATLAYALKHKIPVEWYAVSSGALIAMDSGTENMDWIALTLRRLIEYTQAGGEVNIIVTGINVGGQPYWNAEATMLMHTKGILVMTPVSAMVLTGKQALDFSGAVSADDNFGIGGFDRVMGLNGQGQYWAPSFQDACALLLQHYDYTYVVPGERFPRRRPTRDPIARDVRQSPHDQVPGTTFTSVSEVFDHKTNPDRKQPFDMRSVMRAVTDTDCRPLERWQQWQDGENSIVWDATVGGIPVCMIGLSSRNLPRKGYVPADGPPAWTSGTLFPQASRKTARAVNATSGNRPLVVLANLSGFDGSPESMRKWQLEYGAEIGRAVTNFKGPIVFVVVSRYHGGAFVVFSKALTDSMEIAAVEGSYASVIGGAPAAATVFAREVKLRTEKDARVVEARAAATSAKGPDVGPLRAKAAAVTEAVRSEKLGEVADEFDSIHTIERALRVGSVDRIIAATELRPYVIDALERGMAKFIDSTP